MSDQPTPISTYTEITIDTNEGNLRATFTTDRGGKFSVYYGISSDRMSERKAVGIVSKTMRLTDEERNIIEFIPF